MKQIESGTVIRYTVGLSFQVRHLPTPDKTPQTSHYLFDAAARDQHSMKRRARGELINYSATRGTPHHSSRGTLCCRLVGGAEKNDVGALRNFGKNFSFIPITACLVKE